MKTTAAALALTGTLCFCGCEIHIDGLDAISVGTGKRGSGNKASQTREVAEFKSITVEGSGKVTVNIGDEQSVEVEIDDNLLEIIETEVEDGELTISSSESYSSDLGLHVKITMQDLDAVQISGSGDVDVSGVDGGELQFQINGSGDIGAEGRAEVATVVVNGSGDVNLLKLETAEVNVRIAGSGDVKVHATHKLNARVMGSGDVTYMGDPKVETSIMGSGDVIRQE